MAEAVHESSFWLPSEFLSDDDLFFPPNLTLPHPSANSAFPPFLPPPPPPSAGSPPLFPRSSSALTSPGESVVSSTETETSADDPDEFIADLTRHLALSALRDRATKPLPLPHHHHHHSQEKAWGALATSPQSTLSGFSSWTNRRRTPPASDDEAWELIYAAAERIANMRMSCQAQLMKQRLSHMAEARTAPVCYNAPQNHHHQFQQIRATGRCGALPHSSFPPLRAEQQPPRHHHHHHGGPAMRAVYLGGTTAAATAPAGIKKQSTGTGVFLPRRVGTTATNSNPAPAEPRKKQGGCSTVLVPARVVQALNLLNNRDEDHTHTHTHPLNHDMLVARRNGAIMGQQQRRGLRGEPLLPQEWTY